MVPLDNSILNTHLFFEAFREAHAQEISALQEKLEAGNALYEKLQATVNEQKAVIEDLEKQRIGMDRSLQDGRVKFLRNF